MKIENLKNVILAAVLAASTVRCVGHGVAYTSRSAFDAAIAGLAGSRRDVDFEGSLPPGGTDDGGGFVRYFSPLTISGLTFQPGVLLIRPTADGKLLNNYDSLGPLRVDMNGPMRAFGADFASLLRPFYISFSATVSFDNGAVFNFAVPTDPNLTFFGYVTRQPFSSMTFNDGGLIDGRLHEELLDNITAVVVPEPGVFALFASGALLLGWRLHRTRKP